MACVKYTTCFKIQNFDDQGCKIYNIPQTLKFVEDQGWACVKYTPHAQDSIVWRFQVGHVYSIQHAPSSKIWSIEVGHVYNTKHAPISKNWRVKVGTCLRIQKLGIKVKFATCSRLQIWRFKVWHVKSIQHALSSKIWRILFGHV